MNKFNARWTITAYYLEKRENPYHLLFQCENLNEVSIPSLFDDAELIRKSFPVEGSIFRVSSGRITVELHHIGNWLETLATYQDITVYTA